MAEAARVFYRDHQRVTGHTQSVLPPRVLELHETTSDPFLGMNTPNQRDKPRMGIDAKDAEEQARQDWSNDK
jgi:hypothetical protein